MYFWGVHARGGRHSHLSSSDGTKFSSALLIRAGGTACPPRGTPQESQRWIWADSHLICGWGADPSGSSWDCATRRSSKWGPVPSPYLQESHFGRSDQHQLILLDGRSEFMSVMLGGLRTLNRINVSNGLLACWHFVGTPCAPEAGKGLHQQTNLSTRTPTRTHTDTQPNGTIPN